MAKQPKFWMVYGDGCGRPTYQHNSKASAEKEAKRLAGEMPGHRFTVLASVECFEAAIQPVAPVKIGKPNKQPEPYDDIPF